MNYHLDGRWELLWANRASEHDDIFTFDNRDAAQSWLRFLKDEPAIQTLRMLLCEREFSIERLSDDEVIDSIANRLASRELFVIQRGPSSYSAGMRRMSLANREHLPYGGESAKDNLAYKRYLEDAKRGKTALQLKAVAEQMTPDIRQSWSARSFTAVSTPVGDFDAVTCNVSYHFHRHGQKYGNIGGYTREAKRYFLQHRHSAVGSEGLLKLPKGTFEPDGRIVTFSG